MTARRAQSLPPHMLEPPPKPERGRCVSAICFSWKVLTCIVSHVTLVLLVVSYCVGGAYLFQHLEKPHEIEVKKGIEKLRHNLTEKIWRFSEDVPVLAETDWINSVKGDLANFEKQILTAMKTDGWDGDEDITKSQWTFAGSLFYSIIVITTIGYGHISPRTDWGKVTTIFYAIVGIPLMLLCLSTIGDVMATSFRFIYWRVCCYVCTRAARRPRQRSRQRSMRSHRHSARSQPPPIAFRRSMKLTQRSANDSGFGASMGLPHAYSDPELRTAGRNDYDRDFGYSRSAGGSGHSRGSGARGQQRRQQHHYDQQPQRSSGHRSIYDEDYDVNHRHTQTLNRNTRFSSRQRHRDRMRDRHTVEREHHFNRSRQNIRDYDDSMDDFCDMQPPVKRTMSVRSTRSPYIQRDEPTRGSQDSRASRELNRLHSHQRQAQPPRGRSVPNTPRGRAKSVGPRPHSTHYDDVDEELARKTPIISNRYALDDFDHAMGDGSHNRRRNGGNYAPRSQSMPRSAHQRHHSSRGHTPQPQPQAQSHSQPPRHRSLGRQQSRYGNQLELPDCMPPTSHMNHVRRGRSPRRCEPDYDMEELDNLSVRDYDCERGDRGDRSDRGDRGSGTYDDYSPRQRDREHERRQRRQRAERLPPSPRIMSPMGFPVQRQIYRRRPSNDYDEDSLYGDEYGDYCSELSPKERPVPIWLCVFLVISYILGGAILFTYWEQWSFLDSAYFCFITLTTIGFGDFVPAKGVKDESEQSIAYCSLYLLFGIALLAMSFNLVQEEFINNVKEVARRLGILRDEEEED